ncbi:MAG: deacetylase sulfotransferase, partial [Woeseiaceae bacterium]
HRFVRDREPRTFDEVCAADMKTLEGGWENLPTGDMVRLGHWHYSYLPRGFYYEQLKTWMGVFPREQFLIVRAENFFSGRQEVFDEVLDFIGLAPHRLEQSRRHNVGQYSDPMSDDMRRNLAAYFRPHNERLYEFLGRDLEWEPRR